MSKLFSRKVQFFACAIILPHLRTMVAASSSALNIQAQPQIAIKNGGERRPLALCPVYGVLACADFKLRHKWPTRPPRVWLGADHRAWCDLLTRRQD